MSDIDENELKELIEAHKYIWEDEFDDHVITEMYDDIFPKPISELYLISNGAYYHFNVGDAMGQAVFSSIIHKVHEAGIPIIKVDVSTIQEYSQQGKNWVKEVVATDDKNQGKSSTS